MGQLWEGTGWEDRPMIMSKKIRCLGYLQVSRQDWGPRSMRAERAADKEIAVS